MRQRPKCKLDKIDMMIIQELSQDGRMPVAVLAAKTGINHRTARSRLEKIIDSGIVKVVAAPIVSLPAQSLLVSIGFNIKPEYDSHAVAERLASYPNFFMIVLTAGPYDIVGWAFFSSLNTLSAFLRHEIGTISGITSNETLIHFETVKNVPTYPLSGASPYKSNLLPQEREVRKRYIPDKLDMLILRELQKDGRMPVVELAKELGINRVSTARRLQRLLSEGITKVVAVSEPGSFGYEATAMIGIKVLSGKADEVAEKLATYNSVHFVAITLGQYNVLLGVHFSEIQSFSDFMRDGLGRIPDIVKTENIIYLEVIKSPWESISTID